VPERANPDLAVVTPPVLGFDDRVLEDQGSVPEIDTVAFSLPVGGVSDAIATPQGAAVIKVVSRQGITSSDYTAARDKFRGEALGERRNRFYQTYMQKARARMKIEIDREALQRAVGQA